MCPTQVGVQGGRGRTENAPYTLGVAEEVLIERRFRGPPESGQGGYSCGLVAERIEGECATVSLRKPPPLERTLRVDGHRRTPSPDFAGDDGAITKLITWAALDCPTATGANLPLDGVSVLARLTCKLVEPIEPGVAHTVVSWPISDDGRKHVGGCAIHSPDGRLCAYSAGLWIELRDPATMGAKTKT
jgi:hypothetical protein